MPPSGFPPRPPPSPVRECWTCCARRVAPPDASSQLRPDQADDGSDRHPLTDTRSASIDLPHEARGSPGDPSVVGVTVQARLDSPRRGPRSPATPKSHGWRLQGFSPLTSPLHHTSVAGGRCPILPWAWCPFEDLIDARCRLGLPKTTIPPPVSLEPTPKCGHSARWRLSGHRHGHFRRSGLPPWGFQRQRTLTP